MLFLVVSVENRRVRDGVYIWRRAEGYLRTVHKPFITLKKEIACFVLNMPLSLKPLKCFKNSSWASHYFGTEIACFVFNTQMKRKPVKFFKNRSWASHYFETEIACFVFNTQLNRKPVKFFKNRSWANHYFETEIACTFQPKFFSGWGSEKVNYYYYLRRLMSAAPCP